MGWQRTAGPTTSSSGRSARALRRWLWRGVLTLALVLIVRYVLIPQFSDAGAAVHSIGDASLPLIGLGLGIEIVSVLCYSALTRSALNAATRPGFFTILRIDLANLGINNAVPGGGAAATAARFRMLILTGMRGADAVSGTTIEIATSVIALGGIFGVGVALSLSTIREGPEYLIAGALVCAVGLIAGIGTALLGRHRERAIRIAGSAARWVPLLSEETATSFVRLIAEELLGFRADRRRIVIAAGWATANWLFDAASLWVFLLAFGYRADFSQLLVAYGLASILGLLPITPGGLGIIEGVLVPALVGFGSPHAIALLGVIAWRLVEFWLPIPLSGLAYLSLRAGVLRPSPARALAAAEPLIETA